MRTLARFLRSLPLSLLSPFLLAFSAAMLLLTDFLHLLRRTTVPLQNERPSTRSASIVIPSWNARDLLEKYLPSVISATRVNPENEIIVVDNGSTDGTADFLRKNFPVVRLLSLPENQGFGGGSNAGITAATNDIVVLLNNDMRVEPDFLAPLLEGFTDDAVFAVSCQIFFSDPDKPREETGLTEGWWENGSLRVGHRIDNQVVTRFPCFYGGGGSCAFDRRKFLELGGFDPLLAPFYLEDTDLGYEAWKRGWKVLFEPRSKVYHEHRGTIGKRFTEDQIQAVLQKNFILFCWKNIHEWHRLLSHFGFTFGGALVSLLLGNSPGRATLYGLWKAFCQLPAAMKSRWRARSLAVIDDTEAFLRPQGGYFRDRFASLSPAPAPPRVLFVSPYPICPPVHGGGVFMYQTSRQLARLSELHLLVMIDHPDEEAPHAELVRACASAEFVLRRERHPKATASLVPYAVREFASDELRWVLHRKILQDEIDVIQLEYLPMGQYGGRFDRLVTILFEHDIYFQSIGRSLSAFSGLSSKAKAVYEYMRALRYELRLLPRFDRVQVCSRENAEYLTPFLPRLRERLDDTTRAGIDVSRYEFQTDGREPFTMLFVGSFRHQPNVEALGWMVRKVLPLILEAEPKAKLIVVGSEAPARHSFPAMGDAIEIRGHVEEIREVLARYAVFVCPILSGSGVRVKLIEAFAAGIPAVSTRLGAEGLADSDGKICALADTPSDFAAKILELFRNPEAAAEMAVRARAEMEQKRDIRILSERLVADYRRLLHEKRTTTSRNFIEE